jgi:hypothetical protein
LGDSNPGKSVLVGSDVCGELLAVFSNTDDVIAAVRARMQYIGASFSLVEQIADPPMAEGALAKYLAPLQVKQLTLASLMRICEPLGVRGMLFIDPALAAKAAPSWEKRNGAKVHPNRQAKLGQATLRRVLPEVAAELGRRGGLKRRNLPAAERVRLARLAAQARWKSR